MNGETYRPFVVTAVVGCFLWTVTGGFIHAYVISPDWEIMGQSTFQNLAGLRPVLVLICTGLVFGLAIQIAAFTGGAVRSEPLVIFLPIVVGAGVGVLQGMVISSGFWGYDPTTVFRSDVTRLVSGGMCGFILTPPSIMIGIRLRQRGRPW
jgi:glucose-6-phosphate-specific signal transduction histidine kinase